MVIRRGRSYVRFDFPWTYPCNNLMTFNSIQNPIFTQYPFLSYIHDLTRRIRFPSSTLGVPAAFLSNNNKRGSSASHHVATSHLIFQHISAELVWIWDRLLFSPSLRAGLDGWVSFKEYTSARGERRIQGRIGYRFVLFYSVLCCYCVGLMRAEAAFLDVSGRRADEAGSANE